MATADAVRRAVKISERSGEIKAVAVSAGGKVTNEKKITDELIAAYPKLCEGKSEEAALKKIEERISALCGELNIKFDLHNELMKIGREEEKTSSPDFLISRGEYLYSKIFSAVSLRPFVDSAEIIRFGKEGKLDVAFSSFLIKEKFVGTGGFVTGGFYGSDRNGNIKIMPRGGGDITGALLSLALKADVYENYTDVDGVLPFPPDLLPKEYAFLKKKIRPLKQISFARMQNLCDFSVNVLHPDVLKLLKGQGIDVIVKNTFNESSSGTLLSENAAYNDDEFYFAADKFRNVKRNLEQRAFETPVYEKFLKAAKNIVLPDDFVFWFSLCDESEKIILNLKNKFKTVVAGENPGFALSVVEAEKSLILSEIFGQIADKNFLSRYHNAVTLK